MSELPIEALVLTIILILYILTSQLIYIKNIPFIHESSLAILLALIIQIILSQFWKIDSQFNEELFFSVILPPIIFAQAYCLPSTLFFKHIPVILFFGIFSTCLTYTIILLLGQYLPEIMSDTDLSILSSILASTDTVASISIIKFSIYPDLHVILLGEGIVNDAISIVLYRISSEQFSIFKFIYIIMGSVAVGASGGMIGALWFKTVKNLEDIKSVKWEMGLVVLMNYVVYLSLELMNLSGIMGLFVCGIVMKRYIQQNISHESRDALPIVFEGIAFLAEGFVFGYLGFSVGRLKLQDIYPVFIIGIFFITAFARLVSLLPILIFTKKLNVKEVLMVWYGGLIKGAVAFALCLNVKGSGRNIIVATTTIIVFCTVIIFSGLMKGFGKLIRLPTLSKSSDQDLSQSFNSQSISASQKTIEMQVNKNNKKQRSLSQEFEQQKIQYNVRQEELRKYTFFQRILKVLDRKYLNPFFQEQNDNTYQLN